MTTDKEERPLLKIELSITDKILEICGLLILLILWTMVVLNYTSIPETIPRHYSFSGKPDSYGNKTTFLILPIIATVLYVGITILNQFPHILNYPTGITSQNAARQYNIATKLIRYLKPMVVFTFSVISFSIYPAAEHHFSGLRMYFIPVFLGLIYFPLIFAIIKLFRTT